MESDLCSGLRTQEWPLRLFTVRIRPFTCSALFVFGAVHQPCYEMFGGSVRLLFGVFVFMFDSSGHLWT